MLVIILKRIKDAEAHKTHRGKHAHEQRHEARALLPLGVVSQPVEIGRVPHMMHREDGAGKGDARDGAACDENRLERKCRDVADEGDLWVDLAWVSGLADRQPADEEDGERGEPRDAGCEGQDPELVGIAKVVPEDPRPRSCCQACLYVSPG